MSSARYFNLSIPAARRLAMMREDFATHAARFPLCPENLKPASWRDVRALRRQGRRDSDDVSDAIEALREARAELERASAEYEGA
jgi:hypothetical protein